MLSHFAARVRLYTTLDEKLGARTRFFGAAALVNEVLVEWCSLPCPGRWVFGSAVTLLSRAGAHLESLNVAMARRLESGGRDRDLDHRLVAAEQRELETLLQRQVQTARPLHRCAVRQINRLLSWAGDGVLPSGRCPSVGIFSDVLARLRADLSRPLDFALLDDRIGIGLALTRELRGGSG